MTEQVETRVEYRVVGENRDGPWEGRERDDLGGIEREARELSRPGPKPNTKVRIQSRTVTETPWEDVADV
jgi:hypothetical protein